MRIRVKNIGSSTASVWGPLIVLLLVCSAGPASACRYTVREVAFVELNPQVFTVEFSSDWVGNSESLERFMMESRRYIRDSNVDYTLPPKSDGSRITRLVKNGDATLASLELDDLRADFGQGAQAFWPAVLDSPLRRTILDHTVDRLGVVLVVEGAIDSENSRAIGVTEAATRKVKPLLGKMAKPIDVEPLILRISRDSVQKERILLWSLGFDLSETAPTQVATVIGRGRRLGPVLDSVTINETALLEAFVIAGQDCECDLDRVWMQGPSFPMVWSEEFRVSTLDALGFDTEDPAVRSEMSRILARGGSRATVAQIGQQFESLSLGYTETDLSAGDGELQKLDDEALLAALDATLGPEEGGSRPEVAEETLPQEDADDSGLNARTGVWIVTGVLGFLAILGGVTLAIFRRY